MSGIVRAAQGSRSTSAAGRAAVLAALALVSVTGRAQPDEAPDGARLYASYCAACHGVTGEGDGPVAAVMEPAMPNLRTLAMRAGGSFPADAVAAYVDGTRIPASHGSRRMPIWGDIFSWDAEGLSRERGERRIAAIVAFIEELQYR